METDWQNKFASTKERNAHLLEECIRSDCCFFVGITADRKRLQYAHKLILSTASPVFERMFYGSIPEKGDKPIEINDIDAEDFYNLLYFIYTEEVKINSIESAQQLYYAANKYMLDELVKKCIDFLKRNSVPQYVWQVFNFADQFEEYDLKETCMEIIKTKTSEVLQSPSLMQANFSCLKQILLQDELNISNESEIFNALQSYADFHFSIDERRKPICPLCKNQVPTILVDEKNYFKTIQKEIDKNEEFNGTITKKSDISTKCNHEIAEETQQTEDVVNFLKLVKMVRFLTMTPEEFASGPGLSKILRTDDALGILVCLTKAVDVKKYFPKDFCESTKTRYIRSQFRQNTVRPHSTEPCATLRLIKLSENVYLSASRNK